MPSADGVMLYAMLVKFSLWPGVYTQASTRRFRQSAAAVVPYVPNVLTVLFA